jgi:hypothetical protein
MCDWSNKFYFELNGVKLFDHDYITSLLFSLNEHNDLHNSNSVVWNKKT